MISIPYGARLKALIARIYRAAKRKSASSPGYRRVKRYGSIRGAYGGRFFDGRTRFYGGNRGYFRAHARYSSRNPHITGFRNFRNGRRGGY